MLKGCNLYRDTELLTRSEPDLIFLQCIIFIDILILAQLERAGLKRLSNKEITQETKLRTLQKNYEIRTCGHSQTLTLYFRWIMASVIVSRAYLLDIISQVNWTHICWASVELRTCICNIRKIIPQWLFTLKIPIFDYSQTVRILSY